MGDRRTAPRGFRVTDPTPNQRVRLSALGAARSPELARLNPTGTIECALVGGCVSVVWDHGLVSWMLAEGLEVAS